MKTKAFFFLIKKLIYRSTCKVLPLIPTTINKAHMALNTSETTFTTKMNHLLIDE